jgi:chorismate dehydratase
MASEIRLGRIRYINVLPIYHALERGWVENGFLTLVSGTPAELNSMLFKGEVEVSAISSVEYARHFRHYRLLPRLSISTEGDVGSVLFFSRVPFWDLTGREVILSASSATSAALLQILLYELYGSRPLYRRALVENTIPEGAYGLLAIGDEALRLKASGRYPYFLDLGRAWHKLTGLPFVFGVWAVRLEVYQQDPEAVRAVHRALLLSKSLGLGALEEICRHAATLVEMTPANLLAYFHLLNYDLDDHQLKGLNTFYQYLHESGSLSEPVELAFIDDPMPGEL